MFLSTSREEKTGSFSILTSEKFNFPRYCLGRGSSISIHIFEFLFLKASREIAIITME
jgi:hypothetical protein